MIATSRPDSLSALNVLAGRVIALERAADDLIEVCLDCGGVRLAAQLTRKSVETLRLVPGLHAYSVIKSVALDRESLGRAPSLKSQSAADATASYSQR